MGRKYKQLSLEERCEIARLQAEGRSIGQIAAALDRAPSTISREVRRNRGRQVGYKASYAQEQTRARRWSGSRLEREPELRRAVLERLAKGWSPEQVAGRLARQAGRKVISHESIYRFIYAQIARTKDYRWRHLSAARQEQAWLAWPQGRQFRNLDRRPYSHSRTTGGGRRPQQPRALGSRPHAVRQVRPSRAHRP